MKKTVARVGTRLRPVVGDPVALGAQLFIPWIVKRPNGGCQVLFPLTELDRLVGKIVRIAERPSSVVSGSESRGRGDLP